MTYEIKLLTRACHPELYKRVLMWRADCRSWEKHFLDNNSSTWLDDPLYAYTHWTELPEDLPLEEKPFAGYPIGDEN